MTLEEAEERIRAVTARAANLGPVLEVAAQDTAGLIDDSFEESRSPGGIAWEPLSEATIKRRRQGSGDGRRATPLVDTGRLRASASSRAEPTRLRFGTNVAYGVFHQSGSGRMHRPFLPVDGVPGSFTLTSTGAAAAHWSRVRDMVRHYIVTGEVR